MASFWYFPRLYFESPWLILASFWYLFYVFSHNFDTSWCSFGSILGTLSIWANPFSNCTCMHSSVEMHAEFHFGTLLAKRSYPFDAFLLSFWINFGHLLNLDESLLNFCMYAQSPCDSSRNSTCTQHSAGISAEFVHV